VKRMLVNATQPEELRVAMVDGQSLYDLDIEHPAREQKKANVYKARITRIEPSLEACFVEYGGNRHGFLPLKEVTRDYFVDGAKDSVGRANIKEVLKEGQELVIQVVKEERGNKGAALTTFISLAGRFMVLMPNNPRAGGVSRRVEGENRDELRDALRELEIPTGMGVIIRTAGVGRSTEELQWDLDYLLNVWKAIDEASQTRPAPFLIFQESRLIIRALRDYYNNDVGEILIDDDFIYREAHEFMSLVMPQYLRKLKRFDETVPLFSRFQIESQIESAFQREVKLPSGGALVIDHTEALTSIDINSARATKGADIEETATNTNLEAAVEIGRQLKLRDLGGLIVIDFIDMNANKNQRAVESRLREAVRSDRARIQMGRISRFGLLEMSRQRLRPSLGESAHLPCPRCSGQGSIRGIESLALAILRLVEEEASKDSTGRVVAQLPPEVATYLLNEKRDIIGAIEKRSEVVVVLVPNYELETPQFEIERQRKRDVADASEEVSYTMVKTYSEDEADKIARDTTAGMREVPAVQMIAPPDTPAPTARQKKAKAAKSGPGLFGGFILWLKGLFGGSGTAKGNKGRGKQQSRGGRNDRGKQNARGGNRQQGERGQDRNRDRNQGRNQKNNRNRNSGRRSDQQGEKSAQGQKRGQGNRDGNRDGNRQNAKGNQNRNKTDGEQQQDRSQQSADNAQGSENTNPNAQGAQGEGGGNRSRRGRRGGRGRRRTEADGSQSEGNNENNNQAQADQSAQGESSDQKPPQKQEQRPAASEAKGSEQPAVKAADVAPTTAKPESASTGDTSDKPARKPRQSRPAVDKPAAQADSKPAQSEQRADAKPADKPMNGAAPKQDQPKADKPAQAKPESKPEAKPAAPKQEAAPAAKKPAAPKPAATPAPAAKSEPAPERKPFF